MTVTDLLQGVQAEIGGREVTDFVETLNRISRDLTRRRPWRAYQAIYEFDTTENYNTGTVSLLQGSDGVEGSGTAWTSAMEGRKFRVEGYYATFTVSSVTDADTLVLDRQWPYDDASGKSYVIFEDTYDLATDFERAHSVRDITNNATLSPITYVDGHRGIGTLSSVNAFRPTKYALYQGNKIRLYSGPVTSARISVHYGRKPTAVSGPGDTLDLPDYLQDLLDYRLRYVYLLRFMGEDESFFARAREMNATFREQYRVACNLDTKQAPVVVRNARTNF